MKYYSTIGSFKFTWDQVCGAFWSRYPNPYSTHVLSEDTISRYVQDGKLYSTRLLTKSSTKAPKWGERFIPGPKQIFIVEQSVVDPESKTITTYTRNIGLAKVMTIEEKCTYKPSSENSSWTTCERQAWISSSIFGFSYAIQKFGVEKFKQNTSKTIKGFEYVLTKMYIPDQLVAAPPEHTTLAQKKEKLKSTAKKATELAKSKAVPVVASCTGGTAAS